MCDCDTPSAFSVVVRRARKPHRCDECRRAIVPGERYQYLSGIWDSAPASFHTCLPCVALREWLTGAMDAECVPLGSALGELAELLHYGTAPDGPPDVVGRALGLLYAVNLAGTDAKHARLADWKESRRNAAALSAP